MATAGIVKSSKSAMDTYYAAKIEELEVEVRDKMLNLRRLEAQRNELNSKVRLLREELSLLQEPGSYVGEVVNIRSVEEISILNLAALVIQLLHSPSRVELVPYTDAYASGFEDMLRRKPNVDKLERLTGFRPTRTLLEIIRGLAS